MARLATLIFAALFAVMLLMKSTLAGEEHLTAISIVTGISCHKKVIIHVPYKIHTIHHHHIKKIPIYHYYEDHHHHHHHHKEHQHHDEHIIEDHHPWD